VTSEKQQNDDTVHGHLKSEDLACMDEIITYIFCCLLFLVWFRKIQNLAEVIHQGKKVKASI